MQTKVVIEGYGTFSVEREDIPELISWLSMKEAVRLQKEPLREVVNDQFTGKILINE